ncbi:helix-turn-helix domain-containing protein, partial [Arthrobacter sp. 35/47]|uniref:helix-turn-helix domain-containing protein n=1 Tax=Arthrobacter sp. 35/47 TaxID=269454 RepID=UPI0004798E4B
MLRIALESLPVVTPERPGRQTVRDAWGEVAAVRLGEYGTVLADTVLGPLAAISVHEKERLIETVQPEGTRPWLAPLDCFVAPPASSLAEVPRMLRIALESLPVVTPERPGRQTVRDAWGEVAAVRLGEYGTVLADTVLGPLAAISVHEKERLIETVQAYFRTGSVSETAAELYCHRNTVLNRLARFSQLTGF